MSNERTFLCWKDEDGILRPKAGLFTDDEYGLEDAKRQFRTYAGAAMDDEPDIGLYSEAGKIVRVVITEKE